MLNNLQDSFLEATRNVFELMLDLSELSEQPMESFNYEDVLDISIGVVGELQGEVVYRFPNKTSLGMVNIMTSMELDTVDDFVTSAISEIANIISGNVLTMLAAQDVKCDILPPVFAKPDDSKQYSLHTDCCISSSVGDVCLDIRLNPAESV
ncbi:chemotaxis protein CheX [Sinanaerobacter sp. ZZT-01]|uniref:chemotaxis protein CheX n=1 Tax=Sinanaerobacter sp. ZZT-01 TaxID=3111540 RepID=UPI002D767989|nr:chemotaxis protein CheX [Sinanaerobacter sp. ZZT-01]WRR93014.1 chemotaxis protein CheX [Sinanaerobacter sp. ZZT-01]